MREMLIDNRGPNTLARYWLEHTHLAREIRIAVAYATAPGVSILEKGLRRCARRGPVQIIISLDQSFTEPKALATLHGIMRGTNSRLSVRLTSARMHSKVYLAKTARAKIAIIGSSNLTSDGLAGREELSYATRGTDNAIYDRSVEYFESLWRDAVELTEETLLQYTSWYRPLGHVKRPTIRLKAPRGRATVGVGGKEKFWAVALTGHVSRETMERVADRTDWDEKGWNWFGLSTRRVQLDDLVLAVDRTKRARPSLHLYRIVGSAEVDSKDGRYFYAARDMLPLRRVLTRERRRELLALGIRTGRDLGVQSLNPDSLRDVRQILRNG